MRQNATRCWPDPFRTATIPRRPIGITDRQFARYRKQNRRIEQKSRWAKREPSCNVHRTYLTRHWSLLPKPRSRQTTDALTINFNSSYPLLVSGTRVYFSVFAFVSVAFSVRSIVALRPDALTAIGSGLRSVSRAAVPYRHPAGRHAKRWQRRRNNNNNGHNNSLTKRTTFLGNANKIDSKKKKNNNNDIYTPAAERFDGRVFFFFFFFARGLVKRPSGSRRSAPVFRGV